MPIPLRPWPWLGQKLRLALSVALAVVLPMPLTGAEAERAPAATPPASVLVGVNYFAGWWPEKPNKWQNPKDQHEWLPEYPGRMPLLGQFNNAATMDKEILAAAEHGVDFFAILWYPPQKQGTPDQAPMLARGLSLFMASPKAPRLKFMVEFCNHPPFSVPTDKEWDECIAVFVQAMKHPSYLKVDGRPVFKIHSAHQFIQDAGSQLSACKARLARLRRAAKEAGCGELVIGAGAVGDSLAKGAWAVELFDFSNEYMMVPDAPAQAQDRPYTELVEYMMTKNQARTNNAIPHLPFLGAGWHPRPWGDPRAAYALPTRDEWTATLRRMATLLQASPKLGIPKRDGTVQSAFIIYAWNEFGEGGMLAPTQGEGLMKLEAVQAVFGQPKP